MYVVNYTKSECCCPSWGVEICMQPDSEHSEPDLRNANCICSCHRFVNFSSWMPMSLKYADIKMYVLKITFNALGTVQTTTQGWNHAKSHEARDARRFCKSPILQSSQTNWRAKLCRRSLALPGQKFRVFLRGGARHWRCADALY